MTVLFTKEELMSGFVEGDGKSLYKNLDKTRIDLIKGLFTFFLLINFNEILIISFILSM